MARQQTTRERTYPANGGASAPMTPSGRGGGGAIAWLALALAVATAVAMAVWALAEDDSAGPEVGPATVSAVADDPGRFVGEQVTVSGEVAEVYYLDGLEGATGGTDQEFSGLAFVLDDEDLLVVGARDASAFVTEGDVVQVTGTVREFEAEGFGEDFGWQFDDPFLIDFEGPAIVASAIDPTVPDEPVGDA